MNGDAPNCISDNRLCNRLNKNLAVSGLGISWRIVGHRPGSLFTEHLEEAVSRGQQVGGVHQEGSEEGRADLRLDGWEQSLQLQRQAGQAAADEVELLGGGLKSRGSGNIYLRHLSRISSSNSSRLHRAGVNSRDWLSQFYPRSLKSSRLLEGTLRDKIISCSSNNSRSGNRLLRS